MNKIETVDTKIFRWKTPSGLKTIECFLIFVFFKMNNYIKFLVSTDGGTNPLVYMHQPEGRSNTLCFINTH